MVSTRMACENMEIEDQMFMALFQTDSFLEKDGVLTLYKADGAVLARFEAIYRK